MDIVGLGRATAYGRVAGRLFWADATGRGVVAAGAAPCAVAGNGADLAGRTRYRAGPGAALGVATGRTAALRGVCAGGRPADYSSPGQLSGFGADSAAAGADLGHRGTGAVCSF